MAQSWLYGCLCCFLCALLAAPPSSAGADRSAMRCLGSLPLTRRCYFRNLFFHIPTQRFRFFVDERETLAMYGHNFTYLRQPGAWLALGRCASA